MELEHTFLIADKTGIFFYRVICLLDAFIIFKMNNGFSNKITNEQKYFKVVNQKSCL